MSTIALIIAVGGASAFAATQLAKNSVGSKQLKKNAVVTAKIKNEAVTGAKVKKGTLTGTQVDASTLGAVPTANSAQTAQTAQTANALSASEPWHQVGAPGEPAFLNEWAVNTTPGQPPVAFYKDHDGIVHLQGQAVGGNAQAIFILPPGFRPANGQQLSRLTSCQGPGDCQDTVGDVGITAETGNQQGAVLAPVAAASVDLEGITFRAES
jgi:hypothetical protein